MASRMNSSITVRRRSLRPPSVSIRHPPRSRSSRRGSDHEAGFLWPCSFPVDAVYAASWVSEGLLASGSSADDPGRLRSAEGHGSRARRSVDIARSTRKRVERASLPRYGLTDYASHSARLRFFEFSSLSIRLSSDRSATFFLSSAFLRSSSFKRLASETCMTRKCVSHLVEHLLRNILQPAHLTDVPDLLRLVQDPNDLAFR